MYMRTGGGIFAFAAILIAIGCGGGGGEKPTSVAPAEKIVTEERALGPMPNSAFKASLTTTGPPSKMKPGERATLTVRVKNIGDAAWPAHGRAGDGYFQVNLGDNWF